MANKVVCDAYLNERSVIFSEEIPRWLVGEKGWQQMRNGYCDGQWRSQEFDFGGYTFKLFQNMC